MRFVMFREKVTLVLAFDSLSLCPRGENHFSPANKFKKDGRQNYKLKWYQLTGESDSNSFQRAPPTWYPS
jgi:hypothetical protein